MKTMQAKASARVRKFDALALNKRRGTVFPSRTKVLIGFAQHDAKKGEVVTIAVSGIARVPK